NTRDAGLTQMFERALGMRYAIGRGMDCNHPLDPRGFVNRVVNVPDARHQHLVGARSEEFASAFRSESFHTDLHEPGSINLPGHLFQILPRGCPGPRQSDNAGQDAGTADERKTREERPPRDHHRYEQYPDGTADVADAIRKGKAS